MTKESKIKVVIKAEDEYSRAAGMGAMTSPPSGGAGAGQDYSTGINSNASSIGATLGAGASTLGDGVSTGAEASLYGVDAPSGDATTLAYAQRLEEESQFQSQRLGIIKDALLEESTAMGQHSKEQLSKEKEDNEIKKGNTKTLIGSSLSLMQTLMSGSKKNNKAMFEAEKAYSVGKAMMNAFTGATNAIRDYPAPMSFVVAASALAKGMAMARSIASQKMTKSVGSSGGGLGGSAPSSPGSSTRPYGGLEEDAKRGTQNLVVNIHNPLSDENWAKIVEDNIIPALEDAGDRNVVIDMNV